MIGLTNKSNISFNVRGHNGVSNVPFALIRKMGGVRSILLHRYLGQWDEFHQLINEGLVDYPIFRMHGDDRLYADYSPQQFVDLMASSLWSAGLLGKVWVALSCDLGGLEALEWEIEVVKLGLTRGLKLVVMNTSVGNPREHEYEAYVPLLKLAADNPESVIFGPHEYGSAHPQRGVGYYLARIQFIEQVRLEHKIGKVYYILTEWYIDDIPDDHKYTSTLPLTPGYLNHRGIHSWEVAFRDVVYPGLSFPDAAIAYMAEAEQVYKEAEFVDTDGSLYSLHDRVICFLAYGWGVYGDGDGWAQFDLSRIPELLDWLTKRTPEEIPVTRPAKIFKTRVTLHQRNRPSTGGATINLVPEGTVIEFYDDAPVAADGYMWLKNISGHWMAQYNIKTGEEYLELIQEEVPVEPPQPPASDWREELDEQAMSLVAAAMEGVGELPLPGANLLRTIAKLAQLLDERD